MSGEIRPALKLDTPNKLESEDIVRRARRIKLILMDCDGVLTDGRVWLAADGDDQKSFHSRDGQGIALLHRVGLKTGVISGRQSSALERRAQELQMSFLRQNTKDKLGALNGILSETGLTSIECAFIGDDLADIPVMRHVGLAVAVADAVDETRQAAHFTTKLNGGHGAVREVCEMILRAKGLWGDATQAFNLGPS